MPDLATADSDSEFDAMHTVYAALQPLEKDARQRVLSYILARLDIPGVPPSRGAFVRADGGEDTSAEVVKAATKFESFAELSDAAQPQTAPEKALVAGYWLQVCEGDDSFDGFSANQHLKHVGAGLTNITGAFNNLKSQKPGLALQLKKSGKSRQARKTYKLTAPGIKTVVKMINE